MTPNEFAKKAIGVPWVRWRSDFDGADCFGLLVLYFREVLGVDLGQVPQVDIAQGFAQAQGWEECTDGAQAFMCFKGDVAVHCGVILPTGGALHCEGMDGHPGNVRLSRFRTIQLFYGKVKKYKYVGHR